MKDLDTLIEENSALIYSIVKKYANESNKEDLYQVGIIGFIKAYQNYNPMYNVKFSTYAFQFILGEIRKYAMSDRMIKIGREYSKLLNQINKAQILLEQKYMRKPTDQELAFFLEVDEKLIQDVKASSYYIESLDQPTTSTDDKFSLYDSIQKQDENLNIDHLFLKEEIDNLPKEEQAIIKYRYYMGKTQQEVANLLGVNQVQISRNEKKILSKMKSNYQM